MHGGGRLRFLERRELLPSLPKLPQEEDGADEETELGEMRVLAQGHTAGVEAEFELKPYSRAQSSPPPSAGGPEVPSSPFQSATAHAPPSAIREAGAATPPRFSRQGEVLGSRPLLAPSPWRVLRYPGGHIHRAPSYGLLPPSQTPPPPPARDSRSTRPPPFLSIAKFVSKQGQELAPSSAWTGRQASLSSVKSKR